MALVTAQATSVVHDRLERPGGADVVTDLQAAISALRVMSANELAALRLTTSAMAHASQALAERSPQGQTPHELASRARAMMSAQQANRALRAMATRNLASLRLTTSAIAHTSQALAERTPHGQHPTDSPSEPGQL
jgi:hypothetical protein